MISFLGIAAYASAALAQTEKVVKEFGAGFGGNSLGVFEGGEDTEIEGPQAIYSGDKGEVYMLDQVNSRVVSFDPQQPGELTRSLTLPSGLKPTDLIINQGKVYVWDGKPIALEPSGNGLTRSLSGPGDSQAPDETIDSMFAQTGSEEAIGEKATTRALGDKSAPKNETRQLLASRGKGPVTIDVIRNPNDLAAVLDVRLKDGSTLLAKLNLKVGDKLGAIEFVEIDHAGKMYVLAENVPSYATEGASTFIARYAASGAFEGVYELPLTQNMALSRRFVTVSPDGDVYFMRTRKGVVDVIGVGFRPMKNGQAITLHGPVPNYAALALSDRKGGLVAAVRPLTRERVLETAFAFESVNWRLNASSYGPDPDTSCSGFNRIRRPGYLIGRVNQVVRGIPYCWGCQGNLSQIVSKIERGGLAGNVCTRNEPRSDVIGVDCSSFVSAAWGLSTHFTTVAIPSITTAVVDPWELKAGDALVKPGSHVMLFLRFTPDKKAEIMEASPGACNGRVCRNVYPLASLISRGYLPRRFRALQN